MKKLHASGEDYLCLLYTSEFSAVMERLARSIRSSVLRNMTAITTTASTSGTKEIDVYKRQLYMRQYRFYGNRFWRPEIPGWPK